ncbi:Uncharacterised protein [uncultured archaeon]|nr:Uncharacterised protein [uncultured archaeon]
MKAENLSVLLSKAVFFLLVFFPALMVVSGFSGFFWLNSYFCLAASVVISFFAFGKLWREDFALPKEAFVLALLLAALLSYPVLLITPFFPASADSAVSMTVSLLGEKIPLDYRPYFPLNFSYQIGFPLIVNAFSDVFPAMPVYLWAWLIGVVAGVLQLFGVWAFSRELFRSEKAGLVAGFLFFGTKLVFENLYNGEYSWLMATAFMLFAFCFLLKKSPMPLLLLPAIFFLNPAAAFNCVVFLAVIFLFLERFSILPLGLSLAASAPALYLNYAPIAFNIIAGNTKQPFDVSTGPYNFFNAAVILPPWIGVVPSVVFFALGAYFAAARSEFSKTEKMLLVSLCAGIALYFALGFMGVMLSGKVVEVALLSVLFLAASFVLRLNLGGRKLAASLGILLLLSLFFFSTSSILNHYRQGSKISHEESEFSVAFREFDPSLSSVLVISQGSGKISEFANKVSYSPASSHGMSHVRMLYYSGADYAEMMGRMEKQKEIVAGGCFECIRNAPVKYVAANSDYFRGKLDYPVLFTYKKFTVYLKAGN